MSKASILVISDSHGEYQKIERILSGDEKFSHIIHCGDGTRDIVNVDIPKDTVLFRVSGNVDIYSSYGVDEEIIEDICGKTVYITHGHIYNVKSTLAGIKRHAENIGAQAAFFGHTHIPLLSEGEPLLFNPGALSLDSYGVVTVEDSGDWKFEHRRL